MEGSFVPECYFDTVLLRAILQTEKALNHKKGCNNVVKAMEEGRLRDEFAVGIVDKDKQELGYLGEFDEYGFDKLILFKHKTKHHYVIQLNPPIEKWIIEVANEANIDLANFGLPMDFERLKKITKSELASETPELVNLCWALLESESLTIKKFKNWILYLRENRYKSDINQLKNG
jgi:hypothetical protein